VVSFLLAFPRKSYMHSFSPACVLHSLPISSLVTWSFYLHLTKSTSHQALRYAHNINNSLTDVLIYRELFAALLRRVNYSKVKAIIVVHHLSVSMFHKWNNWKNFNTVRVGRVVYALKGLIHIEAICPRFYIKLKPNFISKKKKVYCIITGISITKMNI
jgi:hypothetical protein